MTIRIMARKVGFFNRSGVVIVMVVSGEVV